MPTRWQCDGHYIVPSSNYATCKNHLWWHLYDISDDNRILFLWFISSQSKWFLLLSNFLGSAALGITLQSLLTHTGRLSLTSPSSPLSLILRFYTGSLFSLELLHPCPDYSWASFKFETLLSMKKKSQWPLSHMLTFGQIIKLLVTLIFFSSLS